MKSILFLLSLFLVVNVNAGQIAVVVNKSNEQTISKMDVRNIYNDNITTWSNGDRIRSYNLPIKNPAREKFSKSVLGTTAKDSAMLWANKKITNSAKNPPKTKKSVLVAALVAKKEGAIGYVPIEVARANDNLRIVMTID